eukprot:2604654-Rhodomonas_salina.1
MQDHTVTIPENALRDFLQARSFPVLPHRHGHSGITKQQGHPRHAMRPLPTPHRHTWAQNDALLGGPRL